MLPKDLWNHVLILLSRTIKCKAEEDKGHGSLAEGWLCMQKFQVQFQSLEENALSRKDGEEY